MYLKNSGDVVSEYNEYNLSSDELKTLKKYHKNLPILNKHKISNIIKTLLKNIYNKDCKFEFIEKNNLTNLRPQNNRTPDELITMLESQTLEKNSAIEYKLFLAIREGDKFFASKCLDKLLPQTSINSNDFTNIRDYKNKLIYYNTLMKKAAELEATPIKDTDLPIHHISHIVGIDDLNYFSRLFKKHMNKTPSQYRKDNT